MFLNIITFNLQAGTPPLVGSPLILIQYIRSYCRLFLHPPTVDAPFSGDNNHLSQHHVNRTFQKSLYIFLIEDIIIPVPNSAPTYEDAYVLTDGVEHYLCKYINNGFIRLHTI